MTRRARGGALATAMSCLLLLTCGCAARGTRSGRGYDTLEQRVCGEASTQAEVTIRVRDQDGAPIPGVHVHLLQADASADAPASVTQGTTNATGGVTLRAAGNHYYSLLVGPVGFVPEARQFLLEEGCTGTVTLTLRVLQVEGLS